MEAATMMAIAAGASGLLSALGASEQSKTAKKVAKEQIAAQKEADRLNTLAAAYGRGTPMRGTAHLVAQGGPNPLIAGLGGILQGGLAGAQFAQMNPNLWSSSGDAGTDALMDQMKMQQAQNTIAQQSLMIPKVDRYGMTIPKFNPGGLD